MLFKKSEQLLWFTTQFQLLYETGIGFITSLIILEQTTVDKELQTIIKTLKRVIEQGKSLSTGLAKYPAVFPHFYIEMIKVGEQTGKLAEILQELHLFYLRKNQFQQEFVRALTYPCIVMMLMLFLTTGLCFVIVPRFAVIFTNFHTPLPVITQMLFASIHLVSDHFVVFGVLCLILIMLGKFYLNRYLIKLKQEPWVLQIPILGAFYQQILLLQLCRVLGLALKAGLSLQDSMGLAKKMFQTTPFHLVVPLMLYNLKQGRRLTEVFAHSQYFPDIFQGLIRIAEETGTLDRQFLALADIFARQLEKKLERSKTLMEPCLMLITGAIVGGVCLAIYYPIFSLGSII